MGNDSEENSKLFWKEIKRGKKDEQAEEEIVRDVNGQILPAGLEVSRWTEYFEQLLNVKDGREVNINVVDMWMPVSGEFNDSNIDRGTK